VKQLVSYVNIASLMQVDLLLLRMLSSFHLVSYQLIAYNLLQQLPAAFTTLSGVQMQLSLQGEAALQLQQQQIQGYAPLLLASSVKQQMAAGAESATGHVVGRPLDLNAVASFRQQPLCHQLFELLQQQQQGGWSVPNYCVYLHDRPICETTEDDDVSAAAAAEQQQKGVLDDAADSLLQLLPQM
jgi:hypothetical protein